MIGEEDGGDFYSDNPVFGFEPAWRQIFDTYRICRPPPSVMPMPIGAGKPPLLIPLPSSPGPLPDSGGFMDQCAWLLDVFDIMEGEDARLMKPVRWG